jgi:hypothetical protein
MQFLRVSSDAVSIFLSICFLSSDRVDPALLKLSVGGSSVGADETA